jgi:hypothetical protein
VIFLSNMRSSTLSLLMEGDEDPCTLAAISTGGDDIDDVNISAIDLFERLGI